MFRSFLVLGVVVMLGVVLACENPSTQVPIPTPNLEATIQARVQATVQSLIYQTQTALPTSSSVIPTVTTPTYMPSSVATATFTVTPTSTSTPLPIAIPTYTPLPTPTSTYTPVPTFTPLPTYTPTATATPSFDFMIAKLRPAIVRIFTDQGSGSGMIIGSGGQVLTSNQIVQGASAIVVELSNGQLLNASVLAADARRDLVVLTINAQNLQAVRLSKEAEPKEGQQIAAIGYSNGVPVSAKGAVSGLQDNSQLGITYIYTDVPVSSGYSGGALINLSGDVIGVIIISSGSDTEAQPNQKSVALSIASISKVLASLAIGVSIPTPTPTFQTRRVGSGIVTFYVDLPTSWEFKATGSKSDWFFKSFGYDDLYAYFLQNYPSSHLVIVTFHPDANFNASNSDFESYKNYLVSKIASQYHVDFKVMKAEKVKHPSDDEVLAVEWQLDYSTDLPYKVSGQGRWLGKWYVFLTKSYSFVVEVTAMENDWSTLGKQGIAVAESIRVVQ